MRWRVAVAKSAAKRIAALPAKERERIVRAVNALVAGPYESGLDVKPMSGRPEWRARVGSWRILFRVEEEAVLIMVLEVGSRGDVYK